MASTRKKEITAKWNAEYTKTFCLRFNIASDADVIKALESAENKCDYIRNLIRKDVSPEE